MSTKLNLQIKSSTLKVRNAELIDQDNMAYLSAPATAGNPTLTVQNITGAATSGYIIVGEIESEKTELNQISVSVSPSGTTITLEVALTFAHPTDTPVYFVSYNQIEFSRAATSGATKTVLASVNLTPDSEFTRYVDTNTTGYAYARAKNDSTYSQYSDEQTYSSPAHNSIGVIIDGIFRQANEKEETFITREDILIDYIWGFYNKVSEIRTQWKHEESSQDASNATTIGGETFLLPSDMKYPDQRSIIAIGLEGYDPLTYISLSEWRRKISGLARTTLNGAVLAGAITVDLVDASRFPDEGTAYISGDAFTWTGKTSNQLTGVTGILAHDSGSVVYDQGATGFPNYYTIQDGVGRIHASSDINYNGRALIIDYYKEITRPDSENDIIAFSLIEPCKDWCSMRIEQKRKDWPAADRYEKQAVSGIVQAIKNERTGSRQYIKTKE